MHNASKPLYLFVVTTLTLFLFGQIVWRSPITGYMARANIEFDCSESDFASPPRETDVHRALESERLPGNIRQRIDHLRSYITVRTVTSSSERSAYEIRFVGTTTAEATEFANVIARHVSRLSNTQDNSQPILVKNAETALRRAQQQEEKLLSRLARLLSDYRTKVEQRMQQAEIAENSNAARLESAARSEPQFEAMEPPVNPQWERLSLEYREARERVSSLKVNHTDDHPLVQTAKLRAEHSKNRLAAAPRFLPSPGESPNSVQALGPPAPVPPASEAGETAEIALPGREIQGALDEMSRVADAVQRASSDRVNAEDAFVRFASQTRHSHTRVTTTPAQIVASIGGTPTLPRLAMITLSSVVLGAIVAAFASRARSNESLTGARVATQRLDLPLPALAGDAENSLARLLSPRRAALLLTRLCEAALIAVAVFIVLVTLSDQRLAAGLWETPFQTFSEVFARYSP